jgi:hypothetical protein
VSKEQEILSAELGKIDHRRAQVECLLTYLPYDPHREEDYQRETLEAELRWLWSRRNEISEQLQHYPALAS